MTRERELHLLHNRGKEEAMPRYDYKLARVELKSGWSTDDPSENYHRIIEDHSRDGWRLVQILAPGRSGTG
jgi:hypothetical protein